MAPLILASSSPRRRELLGRLGFELVVDAADVDESVRAGESPAEYVGRLALDKASVVAGRHPGAFVLGADTTVTFDGRILGKADDEAEAGAMLRELFGRSHQVVTGFAIVGPGARICERVTTEVDMRVPSADEVRGYLQSGEWRGKAGAYAVQGMAAAFVTAVRGSITNVIGLPLAEVVESLRQCGGPQPRLHSGEPA